MNIVARVSKLERTNNERGCPPCATERVVVVSDIEAARDPTLTRCDRRGGPIVVKVLVGDCWSNA